MSLAIPDTSRLTSIVSNKGFSLYFTASSHGYKECKPRKIMFERQCKSACSMHCGSHRGDGLQIDWQLPLSGAHSIMMVNSAQPGEDERGARPPPFHSIYCTITSRVVASTLPLRRQIHSSYFCSTLFSTVGGNPRFSLIYVECWRESSLLILPIFAHRPKGYTHIVSGFKYQPK
jgi:hypothetical protein